MPAMGVLAPRVVVVTRASDLDLLVAEHGTREQARFVTRDRPGWFDDALRRHDLGRAAVTDVAHGIPTAWRRALIERGDLPTFAFAPDDIVVTVGPDGLVANVAKYLERQPVIGVNPDPRNVAGILARHAHDDFASTLISVVDGSATFEERTLIEARLDDGQCVRALNEIFIGHRSHQSARYRLQVGEREERQSSSGVIVATGTGASGWARSISHERHIPIAINATSLRLAVFVREAFPAPGFGTDLTARVIDGEPVTIISEMSEGGVIFGDGIEADFLRFGWGRRVELRAGAVPLKLAVKPLRKRLAAFTTHAA